jgi:hypothetical protein
MSKKRAILRGLRGAAAVAILAALVWLGYQRGHKDGFDAAAPPPAASSGQLKIVTYPVSDLITPDVLRPSTAPTMASATTGIDGGPDFDSLIDLIVSTIDNESWQENGTGEGEIMPFITNLSLVVSQTQQVHDQIADLLQQLRTLTATVAAREIIPALQSMAAYERDETPIPVREFPKTAKGKTAMARLFDEAVENLAVVWGAPTFRGAELDDDFPVWTSGKQIAVWPRGEGLAYVAVQDGDARLQLMAGWQRDDEQSDNRRP